MKIKQTSQQVQQTSKYSDKPIIVLLRHCVPSTSCWDTSLRVPPASVHPADDANF